MLLCSAIFLTSLTSVESLVRITCASMYFSIFAKEYISKNLILFVHALSPFLFNFILKGPRRKRD
jgi:hypothetical protein